MIFLRAYLASTHRCGIRKEMYRADCPDFPDIAATAENRDAALRLLETKIELHASPDKPAIDEMPPPSGLDAMVHLILVEVDG